MVPSLDAITRASLPVDALAQLASLRCEPRLEVAVAAGRLWLRFEPGSERVVRTILPLAGVELFVARAGTWHRFGHSLPAFDVPRDLRFQPLFQTILPAPVEPVPPGPVPVTPVPLTLAPDDRPRPTTAMRCALAPLCAWADTVSAVRLERLHAVVHAGDVLLLGTNLPMVDGADRFWGTLVLVPIGFRPEPELAEADLREAAGVATEELLVLRHQGVMAVPRTAFARLSRAALRLAAEGRR